MLMQKEGGNAGEVRMREVCAELFMFLPQAIMCTHSIEV